jgi:hypothetical protein
LAWHPSIQRRFPDGQLSVILGVEPPDALSILNEWGSRLDPTYKRRTAAKDARADLSTILRGKSVMFVIDDVWPGQSNVVAKNLLVPSLYSHFLLTTRFPEIAEDPEISARAFRVDEMTADQALQMLLRSLGRGLRSEEQADADLLCNTVGRHPFAIELAAARIKESRSWKRLLRDLTTEIARLEALEPQDDGLVAEPFARQTR